MNTVYNNVFEMKNGHPLVLFLDRPFLGQVHEEKNHFLENLPPYAYNIILKFCQLCNCLKISFGIIGEVVRNMKMIAL